MNPDDSDLFKQQLKLAFDAYDEDGSGTLDAEEARKFLDEIRMAINFPRCDDQIFNKAWKILDENGDGMLDQNEVFFHMEKVLSILSEPGKAMEKMIRKSFTDFDIDQVGYLVKPQFKLLINQLCDCLGVERCYNWQIDYIFSLLDDDGNCMIDIEEFMVNYSIINQELLKNKSKIKSKKAVDFFSDGCMIGKLEQKELEKKEFQQDQGKHARKYQKTKNRRKKEIDLEKKADLDMAQKIELVTGFSRDQAKSFVPLHNILNSKNDILNPNDEKCMSMTARNFLEAHSSIRDLLVENNQSEQPVQQINNRSAFGKSPSPTIQGQENSATISDNKISQAGIINLNSLENSEQANYSINQNQLDTTGIMTSNNSNDTSPKLYNDKGTYFNQKSGFNQKQKTIPILNRRFTPSQLIDYNKNLKWDDENQQNQTNDNERIISQHSFKDLQSKLFAEVADGKKQLHGKMSFVPQIVEALIHYNKFDHQKSKYQEFVSPIKKSKNTSIIMAPKGKKPLQRETMKPMSVDMKNHISMQDLDVNSKLKTNDNQNTVNPQDGLSTTIFDRCKAIKPHAVSQAIKKSGAALQREATKPFPSIYEDTKERYKDNTEVICEKLQFKKRQTGFMESTKEDQLNFFDNESQIELESYLQNGQNIIKNLGQIIENISEFLNHVRKSNSKYLFGPKIRIPDADKKETSENQLPYVTDSNSVIQLINTANAFAIKSPTKINIKSNLPTSQPASKNYLQFDKKVSMPNQISHSPQKPIQTPITNNKNFFLSSVRVKSPEMNYKQKAKTHRNLGDPGQSNLDELKNCLIFKQVEEQPNSFKINPKRAHIVSEATNTSCENSSNFLKFY